MIVIRTRNMGYNDYGVTDEEKEAVIAYCRSDHELKEQIISCAMLEQDPYIAQFLILSITQGQSYEKLYAKYEIAVTKDDFYAYRRKAIADIKRFMLWYGQLHV